jgi:hypothetical protein
MISFTETTRGKHKIHRSALAVRAVMRVTSTDPQITDTFPAAGTRFARPLEDIAPVDCLSLAPKQVALRSSQGDTFGQYRLDPAMKTG